MKFQLYKLDYCKHLIIINNIYSRELLLPDFKSVRPSIFFLWGARQVGKSSTKIHADHPRVKRRWIVCLESKARLTDDGIEILPYNDFIERLARRELG